MGAAPILTILKNGETIRSVTIEGEAMLGRSEGCVIRLEDRAISRQHAVFRRTGDQIQVEKKSEFAPLVVNGADCTQAVLKEGDVISIGPYLLKLSLQQQQQQQQSQQPVPQAEPVHLAAQPEVEQVDPRQSVEPAPEFSLEPSAQESIEPLGLVQESENGPIEVMNGDDPADLLGFQPAEELPAPNADAASTPDGGMISLDPPSQDEEERTRVFSQAQPELLLMFKPGEANVTTFRIQKAQTTIGRGKDCDIVLNDKKSSRKNTVIAKSGVKCSIQDLNSSNGTFVNDEKITEQDLSGGDRIRIGDIEFEFRAEQPGYAEQMKDFLSVPPVEDSGPHELPPFQMDASQDAIMLPAGQAFASPTEMQALVQEQSAGAVPGISGIPGLTGTAAGQRKSLMEKFRALPKRRQYIVIFLVIAFGYFFFLDDEAPVTKSKKSGKPKTAQVQGASGATGDSAAKANILKAFSALTKNQKDFVRTQHQLAFDYYKNKEYDKALFEIQQIFKYVDDYEDSREIERYAKEGKRKLEALAEEKARREAEAAAKQKIADLVNEARDKMIQKQYDRASELFSQILALDPENAQVAQWQAKIQQHEEDLRIEAQKRQIQAEINQRAWALYHEGLALRRKGKLREALAVFRKVKEVDAPDPKATARAASQIKAIHAEILAQVEPVMKEAKDAEDAGEFVKATAAYNKALTIEPNLPAARAAVARMRGILTDRAKALYTEAVLAESYSDFAVARKKFKQCMETAPKDSIYHDRAERKLARYFRQDDLMGGGAPY